MGDKLILHATNCAIKYISGGNRGKMQMESWGEKAFPLIEKMNSMEKTQGESEQMIILSWVSNAPNSILLLEILHHHRNFIISIRT